MDAAFMITNTGGHIDGSLGGPYLDNKVETAEIHISKISAS